MLASSEALAFVSPATGLRLTVAKTSGDWSADSANHRASFEISIGNRNCSGAGLRTIVEWARATFGSFEVSLGDGLMRFNYQTVGHPSLGRLDAAAAQSAAEREGSEWLAANEAMLSEVLRGRSLRVMRWSDWMAHPRFGERVDRLRECARNDATFLEVLKADIRRYLARRMIPESEMSSSDLDILRTYILEELAVYWIQASERLTVHVYPGTPLKCLAQIRSFSCIAPALQRRRFAYVEIRGVPHG